MRAWVIAASGLLISGCSAPHSIIDRSDYLAEATRTYDRVSREQVIAAAERVLKVTDPQDWEFRHSGDGFTGLRRYFVYAVILTRQGREKWEFSTEKDGSGVKASIGISQGGLQTAGYSAIPYEEQMGSIPLYRLFWARLDYMLGKRSDWVSCESAEAGLKETNTAATALGGLCGSTSQGRGAPPPPRLIQIAN